MFSPHARPARASDQKPSSRARVLVVDDHTFIRQGLRTVVEDCIRLEVVGEASNGLEAIEAVRLLRPDVVVMDIYMPQMNGIDATTCIKGEFPDTCVIGLSVEEGMGMIEQMQSAGIYAYLTKETAIENLRSAIEEAITHKEGG